MDRVREASNLVKQLTDYQKGLIEDYQFISIVCNYFDIIKDVEKLNPSDLKFLRYISNMAGVPHYFDLLEKRFNHNIDFEKYDLSTLSSLMYESSLHTNEHIKIHKYQKKVLKKFDLNKRNRVFLSASTSFGKTFLVYEVIKKMKYKNIILIFPTIALLSENLEYIHNNEVYSYFKSNYKIHTLSDVDDFSEQNILIYTPERFLSFKEKNPDFNFDFVFVDEVYKLDNEFIMNEETKENERDISYRIALFYILKNNIDILLAGPYIEMLSNDNEKYNPSFDNFLNLNGFEKLDFNNIEIVKKSRDEIKGKPFYKIDKSLSINLTNVKKKDQKLIDIIKSIKNISQNSIIYCSTKPITEKYAKVLMKSDITFEREKDGELELFISHLEKSINENWVVINALRHGIGIHHGLVPKYIQKEIIKLFNDNKIDILISTTTITEGINTSAKNLIVLQGTKGGKPLKKFDAKNIAGRAGRFSHHYTGRVLVLDSEFTKSIESEDVGINHKNYEINTNKSEIDLFHTDERFLEDNGRKVIQKINEQQLERGIPDEIINLFKVVSKSEKIKLYDNIKNNIDSTNMVNLKHLKSKINRPKMTIDWDGFQFALNMIEDIVKGDLVALIKNKVLIQRGSNRGKEYSVLVPKLSSYLDKGFHGLIDYNLDTKNMVIDKAMMDASKFVYNTLKYQLVKYLGVFDIFLRYYLFQKSSGRRDYEKPVLNKLITKLEYNAFSVKGKLASDYGVPYKIVDYYDNLENGNHKNITFDKYEQEIFNRVNIILVDDKLDL